MCVGLLNLQPSEHRGLQVGNGLPEGVLWNEPVVVIVVIIVIIVIVPLPSIYLELQKVTARDPDKIWSSRFAW